MTAEAWVAILAVACVGLLLMLIAAVREWWQMVDQYVNATEETVEALEQCVEADKRTLEACAGWAAETERRERVQEHADSMSWLVAFYADKAEDAKTATRLALSFYGRAVADADQLDLIRVERDGLRADLNDAHAALEDAS